MDFKKKKIASIITNSSGGRGGWKSLTCWNAQSLSHLRLFVTPWTIVHQAHLSMEFSWPEYWRGLPFPPPEDLPDPGIEPASPVASALAGGFFTTEPPGKPPENNKYFC